jgi:GNAT superfamily N-acetyltransferase
MVEIRRIPASSADALGLVAAMVEAIAAQYGELVLSATPSATPDELSPPGGCFVALYEDGRPVAGGGVKRLAADTGEIKRMFVVREARGRGLARVLLAALEDAARDLGYARVRLDTGAKQVEALALYRSSGYREIEDYNANRYAVYWGEKLLR